MENFTLNRRKLGTLATAAAATLAVPALRAQPNLEKPKLAIAVGGKAAFYYLPLTIAEQLGYFKAEGLDVEISDFAGGAKALQAVVGGSADVCSGAFEHTIALQSKGQYYTAFVLQGRAPQIAIGVSTKNMPNYKTLADLKGKKIGVSAPGSSTNMVANLVLSRAGIKPTDVSYIGVGTAGAALTAMRTGQIDAMSNTDPVMTMLEQKNEVRIISDTRTLKGTLDVFGGPMPAGCLYASAEFIQKNPNTCQALANAIVHGLKWLQTAGPGDIIKTVPEAYLLGDRALYLASFNKVREAISPDGIVPDEGPRTALRALSSFDPSIKADRIDLRKIYTNSFALKAKERFKA
ncbi:ABC transporter substrate-binding protein [Rhodoferax sediminis]|jgi:NitT/TauT family transport system substrate-binding protein|uniref:Transporter substrate-binding domain-containing protein n=1 Tax=Rhodoferax sediminis TaxID=2509614 RepID=A0A515DAR5_9BURK|nr:ABC transporter substrate-binding protein [Rhodoferax sediminis]QDL37491.1 transporter substrate-binding domain-containing protein [Rhodoferax sediminis]